MRKIQLDILGDIMKKKDLEILKLSRKQQVTYLTSKPVEIDRKNREWEV